MASNPPRIGANHGPKVVKAGGLRLSDDMNASTTDYVDLIVGDGAPSGDYGRAAGTTLLYFRKDASSTTTAVYASVDGGTTWVAAQFLDAELTALAGLISAANTVPTFTGSGTAALLTLSRDHLVLAAIAVANATGGATGALATIQLNRLDNTTPIASARQVLVYAMAGQYDSGQSDASPTFGSATVGSIVASGNGWALIETSAAGAAAFTISNSTDETLYFAVRGGVVADLTKACTVVGSNSDSAVWSA